MRIIAGEFRGRRLLPPESRTTRPITDRVKQSLFDTLTPRLPDALVYDCFAGTGSIGLEALSRGARRAVFFEADRSALLRLRRNLQTLQLEQRSRVVAGDLFRWFQQPQPHVRETDQADVVFFDPPYRFVPQMPQALAAWAAQVAARHLAAHGVVVFRHDARDTLSLPPLVRQDVREYGGMTLEFLSIAEHNG